MISLGRYSVARKALVENNAARLEESCWTKTALARVESALPRALDCERHAKSNCQNHLLHGGAAGLGSGGARRNGGDSLAGERAMPTTGKDVDSPRGADLIEGVHPTEGKVQRRRISGGCQAELSNHLAGMQTVERGHARKQRIQITLARGVQSVARACSEPRVRARPHPPQRPEPQARRQQGARPAAPRWSRQMHAIIPN